MVRIWWQVFFPLSKTNALFASIISSVRWEILSESKHWLGGVLPNIGIKVPVNLLQHESFRGKTHVWTYRAHFPPVISQILLHRELTGHSSVVENLFCMDQHHQLKGLGEIGGGVVQQIGTGERVLCKSAVAEMDIKGRVLYQQDKCHHNFGIWVWNSLCWFDGDFFEDVAVYCWV